MGKKRQKKINTFQRNPFNKLKGFSVSGGCSDTIESLSSAKNDEAETSVDDLFADEMNMLDVKRAFPEDSSDGETQVSDETKSLDSEGLSEEEQFLAAMEELSVSVEDAGPGDAVPTQSIPQRLKLLNQGRLKPEASLDLHGLLRRQVAEKVRFFLQDAKYQGFDTVLIITGRGIHSEGEPVLRTVAEQFLRGDGKNLSKGWNRAPRRYGGAGALIIFLK